jgi:hypothetical protein
VPTLCIVSAIATIDRYFSDFLLNLGLEKIVLKLNVSVFVLNLVILFYFSKFDLLTVVKGFVFVGCVRLLTSTFILSAYGGIITKKLVLVLIRSAVITLFSIIPFVPTFLLDIKLGSFFIYLCMGYWYSAFGFWEPLFSNI